MSDATGHMDWPGAGPYSVQRAVDGIPVPYYTHPKDDGRVLLIRINPPGTPDDRVREFPDWTSAQQWLETEWRAGRVPRPSTSAKYDQALLALKAKGHTIPDGESVIGSTGKVLTPVDGVLRTHNEIYAMAGMPHEPE